MKRLFLSLTLLLTFVAMSFAQAPEAVNYQAVARDGSGTLLNNQNLTVRIGIYSGAGSTLEYEETHTITTNQYGLFNLEIGQGAVSFGTFSTLDWGGAAHYLKVELDAGSGYVDLGTNQLLSVPYALNAKNAKWHTNGSELYYNDGYVGLGTNNPSAGLELNNAAGYGSAISLNNTGGGLEWRMTSWTDGTFRLVKATGTTFSPLVVEPTEGKIGIGTSVPDQKLSVHSTSGISYIRVSDNTTGVTSGLRIGMSGTGNAYILNDEATKSLSLGTNGTTQLRISDLGYVGVNQLSPDQQLHVKQDVANRGIRLEHQSTTDYWDNGIGMTTKNYKFYYNNLFRADISSVDGSYTTSSDRRLKKDIRLMEPVLDKVMKLEAANYYYIDSPEGAPLSTGFVAQDVEPLFPNLVRETDDGFKGVVYDGFAVVSIKAIQELNDKVEKLEKELEELKKLIKEK
jgi:hypothetical protein